MDSFYSADELKNIGIRSYGKDVYISRKASFYGSDILIGDHVRIDDFCILSGKIRIGNYVHINPYTGLFAGTAGIWLDDFVNISSKSTFYAISDDYTGRTLTSPLVPEEYKNLLKAPIHLERHVIIGTGSTVLPGCSIQEGCAVGAMSLIKESTEAWGIYAGIPAKRIKERSKDLLELERQFLHATGNSEV